MYTLEEIKKVIGSGFTGYTGVEITKAENGICEGVMVMGPQHKNPIGSVHGGAVFTIADTVGGFAAGTICGKCTTVNSSIQYLSSTVNIEKIIAKGKIIKAGKRMLTAEVELFDETERLFSKATLTYYRLGEDGKAV